MRFMQYHQTQDVKLERLFKISNYMYLPGINASNLLVINRKITIIIIVNNK